MRSAAFITAIIIVCALLAMSMLAGCAPTVATEQPYAPVIYDMTQWTKDVTECRAHGLAYKRGFSPKAIGSAGVKGLAQNAGSAPVNILIPVAGAGGGIIYESFEELGLTDLNQQ